MKAIQLSETGGPEVLRLVDVETPQPDEGQVLIKVAAAGVNFGETQQRQGTYPISLPLPIILGSEAAGTVAALGSGVSSPAVGSRVAVMLSAAGGYAEYVVADANTVIPLPDALDFPHATALLSQGLTAYYLLHFAATPKPGDSVLVHAGAGGVGSIAVQLAKIMGAGTVIGTAGSASKLELVKELGADVAIDYTGPNWVKAVKESTGGKGPDIILESVGGEIGEKSFQCLAPFGRIVVYGALSSQPAQFTPQQIMQLVFANQAIVGFAMPKLIAAKPELAGKAIQEMLGYVASGQLKIIAHHTFPLAEAAAAHRAIEERKTTGKVVLTV